jgi:hypothetical protein
LTSWKRWLMDIACSPLGDAGFVSKYSAHMKHVGRLEQCLTVVSMRRA